MDWAQLLSQDLLSEDWDVSEEYIEHNKKFDISEFEWSYEKIVSSDSFRSLQDKTQVFPLAKSDFVRTRLTHSIETSSIAKKLSVMCARYEKTDAPKNNPELIKKAKMIENLKDIEMIVSAAGLLHDLGNPPFGHAGEKIIGEWFEKNLGIIALPGQNGHVSEMLNAQMKQDLIKFNGNAQTLRILAKSRYQSGINVSRSIISALLKYPTRSIDTTEKDVVRKKPGVFHSEEDVFDEIVMALGTTDPNGKEARHPLAYIVEAADDIAYTSGDLEDVVKSEIVSFSELLDFFNKNTKKSAGDFYRDTFTQKAIVRLKTLVKEEKDKKKVLARWMTYLRKWMMYSAAYKFSEKYDAILNGTFTEDLLTGTNYSKVKELLAGVMERFVYHAPVIVEPELSATTILDFLLEKLVGAMVRYDDKKGQMTQDKKVLDLLPDNYKSDYEEEKAELNTKGISDDQKEAELLYHRILIAVDYISSMTDGYAKEVYKKLAGIT